MCVGEPLATGSTRAKEAWYESRATSAPDNGNRGKVSRPERKASALQHATLRELARSAAALAVAAGLAGCPPFIQPRPDRDAKSPADKPAQSASRAIAAGDFAGAEEILQKALAARPDPPPSPDPETAALLAIAARLRIAQQLFPEAERDASRALAAAPATGPLSELTSQRAIHYRIAEAYEDAGRDDEAVTHLSAARTLCLADPALSDNDACESERAGLVRILLARGRYPEAEPLLLGRIADVQAHNGAYDLRLADVLADAASFYCRQGQYELCGPLYARSFDIWKTFRDDAVAEHRRTTEAGQESPFASDFVRVRARHAPFTAPTGLDEQGSTLYKLGKPDEAAAAISYERRLWESDGEVGPRAMDALNAIVAAGREGAELALAQEAVGYVYFKRGDYTHAEEHYRQALSRVEALWPSLSATSKRRMLRDYLEILATLVLIDRAADRYGEAIDFGKRALELAEAQLDARDALRLDTILGLATSYREVRDVAKAEEFAVRYLDAVEAARGSDHPDYAWALRNLAYVYLIKDAIERSQSLEAEARWIWSRHPVVAPEF